jgi:hypothetical protein
MNRRHLMHLVFVILLFQSVSKNLIAQEIMFALALDDLIANSSKQFVHRASTINTTLFYLQQTDVLKTSALPGFETKHNRLKSKLVQYDSLLYLKEIKQLYFTWLHTNALLDLSFEYKRAYQEFPAQHVLQYQLGDISSERFTELNKDYSNSKLVYNNLQDKLLIESNLISVKTALQQYQLVPVEGSFQIYEINKENPMYLSRLKAEIIQEEIELLEFILANTKNSIFKKKHLEMKNQETLQELGSQQQIANKASQHSQAMHNTTKQQLNVLFRILKTYEKEELELAREKKRIAKIRFSAEDIDYITYLKEIKLANELFAKYYNLLNEYNQKALDLEYQFAE